MKWIKKKFWFIFQRTSRGQAAGSYADGVRMEEIVEGKFLLNTSWSNILKVSKINQKKIRQIVTGTVGALHVLGRDEHNRAIIRGLSVIIRVFKNPPAI